MINSFLIIFKMNFSTRKWERPTIQGDCQMEIRSDYTVKLTFWSEPACRYRVTGKVLIYWHSPDKGIFRFYSLRNSMSKDNDKMESFSVPFYIERGDLYDFDGGYHAERYVLERDPIPIKWVRQEKVCYYQYGNYDDSISDESYSDESYRDIPSLKRSNSTVYIAKDNYRHYKI
jgi:hypothetical protein